MSKKMGFVINTKRCVGCKTCTVACKMENNVAADLARIRVLDDNDELVYNRPAGTYPNLQMNFVPIPCQHCENPACVDVCPTGASQKREDGVVFIDKETCIGCGACILACPYDSGQMDEEEKVVDKCDLCRHRIDAGKEPMCVLCCPGRAIVAGDLNDPNSEAYKLLNSSSVTTLKPEEGTKPATHYIF